MFAPHPDDETFGCGGTIAKKNDEGFDLCIVVMTDGRNAFSTLLGIESQPTPIRLKEIRRAEANEAIRKLGVPEKNLRLLDYEDGSLEGNYAEVETSVAEILKETHPDEIYVTSEKDVHPDHKAACRMIHELVERLELESTVYQYSIAQKYSRLGPLLDRILGAVRRNTLNVDISDYLPMKREAIEEYKSQISIISPNQQKPVIQNVAHYLGREEVFRKSRRRNPVAIRPKFSRNRSETAK